MLLLLLVVVVVLLMLAAALLAAGGCLTMGGRWEAGALEGGSGAQLLLDGDEVMQWRIARGAIMNCMESSPFVSPIEAALWPAIALFSFPGSCKTQ